MSWHWLLRTALSEAEALEQTLGATGVSLVGNEELSDVDDGVERIHLFVRHRCKDRLLVVVSHLNAVVLKNVAEILQHYDPEGLAFDLQVLYCNLKVGLFLQHFVKTGN